MSEWREYKLGDIAEVKGGKRLPKGELLVDYETPHPYIRVTDLGNKWIKKTGLQFVTPEVQKKISRYTVNYGNVILSIVGSIGFVGRVSKELDGANLTENCVKFLTDYKLIDDDFLFYFLISNIGQEEIEKRNVGSTQPKLPLYNIKDIEISLPPLPEQTVIASVLSSLDDKIDLLHRQNETLEKMAETLFRQWFVEEAKEDWEIMKLGTKISTNKYTVGRNYSFSQIEYLDTSSITNGVISGTQQLDILSAPSRAKRLVRHNDIIISTVRPDQRHFGIVKYPKDNLVVSTGFCVITCHSVSPYFVYLSLTNNEMTEYLHSIAEGSTSTYPSLRPADIENLEMAIPSIEKQQEFDKLASSWFNKTHANNKQIEMLTLLRNNLLPKLMNKEIIVN